MTDLRFTPDGWNDYLYWERQDKKTIKKINSLIDDIQRNGVMKGTGKPEPLKISRGLQQED